MGCIDSIKSLGTYGYDASWSTEYKGSKGALEKQSFVIYNDAGDKCKSDCNEPKKYVYSSYFDPMTGYVYDFDCPTGVFIKGLASIGASIVRPFVLVGVEIAEVALEREFKPVQRITNIARACMYSISMIFCSLGMVLFPFSTACLVKLAAVERAANRGIHQNKKLRVKDKDKYTLYLAPGIQPRGHIRETRNNRAKYKMESLWLFEENKCVDKASGEIVPFYFNLKLGEGNILLNNCKYGIQFFGRQLQGKEKQQIEGAIQKLVEITLRNSSDSPKKLNYVCDEGVNSDEYRFNFKHLDKKTQEPILLEDDEKAELKAYSFINTNKKDMSLEDLWKQVKEKIKRAHWIG